MSFNRLHNDYDTYGHDIRQSIGPGNYMVDRPRPDCQRCFVSDPTVRLGAPSLSMCDNKKLVDLDSELMGITRKASKCPTKQYLPGKKDYCHLRELKDCKTVASEDTRLSNPPCTLRGGENGFNRWEWLCMDPQRAALKPFRSGISNRIVVKDNHRPCIDRPMDPSALPPQVPAKTPSWCSDVADVRVPNLSWKPCDELYV
jgi:hypothetical protein